MDILKLLVVIMWCVWLLYWLFSAIGGKQNIRKANWHSGMLLRLAIFILILMAFHIPSVRDMVSVLYKQTVPNILLESIGMLLFLLGFGLSIWARTSLGKNWGMPMTIKKKPELVTTGPYAYVRHPIYTAMIIATLGTALVVNLVLLIPFVIAIIYFSYSLFMEEHNLMQLFPKKYEAYKKHTKALIPFIY